MKSLVYGERTSHVLPGLTAPAEIVVDRWGVPHIYAASTYDAFRAQGFNSWAMPPRRCPEVVRGAMVPRGLGAGR